MDSVEAAIKSGQVQGVAEDKRKRIVGLSVESTPRTSKPARLYSGCRPSSATKEVKKPRVLPAWSPPDGTAIGGISLFRRADPGTPAAQFERKSSRRFVNLSGSLVRIATSSVPSIPSSKWSAVSLIALDISESFVSQKRSGSSERCPLHRLCRAKSSHEQIMPSVSTGIPNRACRANLGHGVDIGNQVHKRFFARSFRGQCRWSGLRPCFGSVFCGSNGRPWLSSRPE